MREFGKVGPTFWTRGTGKALRGHPEAQIVALYLMSAPTSNMIGLYYLPISTIAHDTGLPLEGASKGLRRASEGGFCTYDEASEMVFVHTMAPRQLGLDDGEALSPKDNRVKAIVKLMRECGCAVLLDAFHSLYRDRMCLPPPWWEAPSKGLARGSEGARKGLRSQEMETEIETETERETLPRSDEHGGEEPGDELPKPKRKTKPFEEMCPRAQVIETYCLEYARVRGVRPPFGSREAKSADKLIDTLNGDHARAMTTIRNAFADPYWREKVTMNTIATEPAKFDGQRQAKLALVQDDDQWTPPTAISMDELDRRIGDHDGF